MLGNTEGVEEDRKTWGLKRGEAEDSLERRKKDAIDSASGRQVERRRPDIMPH